MIDPETTPEILSTDALVNAVAANSRVERNTVRKVLAALVDTAGDHLFGGVAVRIQGLGILEPRAVPAREGRMAVDRERHKAWSKPAHRKVVFKPAKALRDRIAGPGK